MVTQEQRRIYEVSSSRFLRRAAQSGRAIAKPAASTASRKTIEPRSMTSFGSKTIPPRPNQASLVGDLAA